MNEARANRCYKCRVPRAAGEMTEASAAIGAANTQQTRTVLATAARLGAKYRPTWPVAALLVPFMIVATALSFLQAQAFGTLVDPSGAFIDDPILLDRFLTISVAGFAALAAGLVIWSIWIAMIVANIPALTARRPPNSPLGAFSSAWIPIINLKRPHTVVRGVLSILTETQSGPRLLALAWWLAVLAAWFGPTIVQLVRPAAEPAGITLVFALQVRAVLLVVAMILAVAVVLVVEQAQRAALNRRAVAVLGEPAAAI
jgi:hypothetical protein